MVAEDLLNGLEDAAKGYKWNNADVKVTHFRFSAIQNQQDYKKKQVCRNKSEVVDLNESLVKV